MPHLQAAAEPATQPRLRCRHILTSGHRCQSPCLRGEEFCYFHHTTRRPTQNPRQRRARQAAFQLPHPEDRTAIQTAIGHVLQRIAANDLDPRRAGLLLYGLQIASSNLPKPTRSTSEQDDDAQDTIQDTVQDIILHPTLGPLAPVAECKPTRHDSLIRIFLDRMNQDPELQKRNQENQAKQNQRNPQNQQTTHPPATHPNLNLNHNHNDLNLDLDNHDLDDGLDDLDLDGQATSDLEAAAAHPQPAILPTLRASAVILSSAKDPDDLHPAHTAPKLSTHNSEPTACRTCRVCTRPTPIHPPGSPNLSRLVRRIYAKSTGGGADTRTLLSLCPIGKSRGYPVGPVKSSCPVPGPNSLRSGLRIARSKARAARTAAASAASATPAPIRGWCVANQVKPTAAASSPVLSAMFEIGSGLGVTAARSAVFDPCAASATTAPIAVARICISGESCALA